MKFHERFELGCCRGMGLAANGKFAKPGSKPSYAPDQNFDTHHIRLEIDLDVPKKIVRGKCTLVLEVINDGAKEIRLDAVKMKILGASLSSGEKLKTNYNGEKLIVKFPKAFRQGDRVSVDIQYQLSNPIAGVYFIGPDKFYPKKPVQVWTHGEAEESRCWFPCFDAPHDKATTEMIATVPKDFFALSNGALISVKENKNRTKSYHWKQSIPHSPYLVTLVAGKFSEIKDEWDGIPVLYYCEPGREADTKRAFGKTPKMIQFFSESIGVRYPYEKYAQIAVTDFVMGGMEHTTATTQTDRVLMDAKAYPEFTADWLVSHELAHQWFGDLLTCKEWSHAWLNESFATYFEALFTEHDLGKDEFDYEMLDKAKIYFDEDKNVYRRAIVTNVYRKPDDLFDRHLYEKGSLVLHMIRHLLGDKGFWKAIHHYVDTFAGKAVETNDLINAIQASTGKNFRKFFDQWVYGAGHPFYTVNYWWDARKKTAKIRVLQKSGGKDLFSMPVDLEFITRQGSKKFRVTIDEKKHEFSYRFAEEPLDFRFDPGHYVLKNVEMIKPYRMWVKQLESDPHAVGRADAAKEIAKVSTEESVKTLSRAFQREKFWGTAAAIAGAIGSTRLESARRFLVQSLKVKHPKIRRGVVESLGQFQDDETASKLSALFEKDPSYFVASECLRSLAKSRSALSHEPIKRGLAKPSWNDVICSAAISTLAQNPTKPAVQMIRGFSRYGKPLSVRAGAIQSISKCAKNFPELFDDLIRLTADPQIRIKQSAIHALGDLKDPRAVPVLEKISKDKNFPYRTQSAAQDALLKINPDKSEN